MRARLTLGLSVLLYLSAFPTALHANASKYDLGTQVLSLMRRALAVKLPEKLPADVARRVPEHAVEEYEQYHRFVPGEGFFEPEFLKATDPGLYRELRKFWTLKPLKQIQVIPYFGEQYLHEDRAVQKMIVRLIDELAEEAGDVAVRDDLVVQTSLTVLERSSHREDKIELLTRTLSKVRMSEGGYKRLLGMARKWGHDDAELRQSIIGLLADGRNDTKPPPEVSQYVLEVAKSDICYECRRAAINYWQVRYLGCEAVLPVYLANLDEALRAGDAAITHTVMMVVGIKGKCVEGIPGLIRALEAPNPVTRAEAVTALENTVGIDMTSIPKQFQVVSLEYENPPADPAALERLARATNRWKTWWNDIGDELLRDQGPDAVRDKGRHVYSAPAS